MGVVARQSIKGTVATYVGVAVGIVTTFFVQTKYLTTEEIGLVDVLLQSAVLFSGLAQLGTNTSAMRYYPFFKDEAHRDHGFFGWTLVVPLVGFAIFLCCFFALQGPIASFFSEKSALFIDYIYYVIPLSFFMLYISVFETNSNLLMRIVVPRFIREVGLRVLTLVTYLLYGFHILPLTGMIVVFCVSYGLATVVNIVYLLSLHRVSFRIDLKYLTPKLRRDFLIYTIFLITSALAGNITPLLNRYFVAGKQGLAMGGILTIAIYIASLVEMPYRSLGTISKPQISQAMADGNVEEADRICKNVSFHQFLVGSLVLFFIWINIDTVFALLPNGEVFKAGKWAVLVLSLIRLVNSTLNVGTTVLSYSKIFLLLLVFHSFSDGSGLVSQRTMGWRVGFGRCSHGNIGGLYGVLCTPLGLNPMEDWNFPLVLKTTDCNSRCCRLVRVELAVVEDTNTLVFWPVWQASARLGRRFGAEIRHFPSRGTALDLQIEDFTASEQLDRQWIAALQKEVTQSCSL